MKYYNVIVFAPLVHMQLLTYSFSEEIHIGSVVEVPLGKRATLGVVHSLLPNSNINPEIQYKNILKVVHSKLFSSSYMRLLESISKYYAVSPNLVLRGVLSKNLLEITELDLDSSQLNKFTPENLELTPAQSSIEKDISKNLEKFNVSLVHGVTGSGKTEIFIELAKKIIESGKQVLYIVPEISLTPQMIDRISKRLGFDVGIFHSQLTPKNRLKNFWGFTREKQPFLIGARSSLFIPSSNIGLIIVDEEHEQSYKQDELPYYNLRDMAVLYGQILDIPVILSSATPSTESIYNSIVKKYKKYQLFERPYGLKMPDIKLVDMKTAEKVNDILSTSLYDAIYSRLKKDEQIILLINRKGYTSSRICSSCREIQMCSNCSIPLVYYKSTAVFKCHYCDSKTKYLKCTNCGSSDFFEVGAGTEKAYEVLDTLFPNEVIQMDSNKIKTHNQLSKSLKSFQNKEKHILLGTKLVAKGLDFSNVTLAGVLQFDNMLSMPDFRAEERAYQLITQITGRSGRDIKGEAIIQTYKPESIIFNFLQEPPMAFYEYELQKRELLNYPPYSKLVRILITYTNEERLNQFVNRLFNTISLPKELTLRGPVQAPIYKIKNRYRMHALVSSNTGLELNRYIFQLQSFFSENKVGTMRLTIDKDPHSFF